MTIAMSEQVDAEPCDVLRGGDGPVYFLLGGQLYVVHEILGRWIEPEGEPRRRPARHAAPEGQSIPNPRPRTGAGTSAGTGTGANPGVHGRAARDDIQAAGGTGDAAGDAGVVEGETREPAQVEHWLVVASVGRFGTPGVFRLQRRPAPPANGPDNWTARAERR